MTFENTWFLLQLLVLGLPFLYSCAFCVPPLSVFCSFRVRHFEEYVLMWRLVLLFPPIVLSLSSLTSDCVHLFLIMLLSLVGF